MAGTLYSIDQPAAKAYEHSGFSTTITSSISTPFSNPWAISWGDDSNLYSSDNTLDKLYEHSGFSTTITSSFSSPSSEPWGVSWGGDSNLYSCSNALTNKAYKHSGFSTTITSSFSSPGIYPTGVSWGGDSNLYSSDSSVDKLYEHSGFSTTITSSINSPSTQPQGVSWGGDSNLYSCDGTADKLYKHSGFSTTITSSFSSPGIYPTGVSWAEDPLITQSLSGASTNSGALAKLIKGHTFSGASTNSGALDSNSVVSKALAGASTNAGALNTVIFAVISQAVSGASTNSGALSTALNILKALSGASTNSGSLLKTIKGILVSGASTNSGSLLKAIKGLLVSGASTNSGSLLKTIKGILVSGASTNTGALTSFVNQAQALAGVSTNSGALLKKLLKQLTGTSSSSGAVATLVMFNAKWSIEHLEASTAHGFPTVYVEVNNTTQPTGAFPTGTVFERKLLEIPRLQEVQLDSRFGVSGFQRVTLQVDNSGGALNSVDIQDAFVRMFFVDADGNIYKEFKGKVVDWTLSHTATINVEDIDALAFTEELPKRTLNDLVEAEKAADGTFASVVVADDLGKPIPIIFGRNVKVPLLYVKADETNREYDYIIGEGVGLNSNNFQEVFTAYRNEQALDSIEGAMAAATSTTLTLETADKRPDSWYKYWWAEMLTGNAAGQITDVTAYDSATNKLTLTAWGTTPTSGTYRLREWRFYDGSQVSPYVGYAFIRFKKRLGTIGRTDDIYADLNGLQDEVNRARAIESILSNATWGLGLTVDSTSFGTAASAMTAISAFTCEGAILSKTTAIDIFTKLLSFRDMVLSKDDSIKISVDAAKTSSFNFGLGDETGYSNILNASPAINYVHPDQKVKDLKVRYRKNYKENDTYLHEFKRSSSANGVDDTLDLPFVYDHTTADNALDYKRKRLAIAIKNLSLDVGQDGGSAKRGDLVTVYIPTLGISSDWEVIGSNVIPAGSNSLSLVPYSATPYTYTTFVSEGGTLPVDESFDITPDYSSSLPDPVSSVIVTAGFTTQPNSKVGFMDVSWTIPNDGNYSDAEVLIKVNGEPASSYITVGTGFENFRVNTVEIGESYDVLVTSLNITGELKGIGTEDLNTLIPGDTTNPNAPTGLSFVGSMLGELTWSFTASTSTDVQQYEYQIDNVSSFSTPVFEGESVDLQIKYSGDLSGGLASGVTRWARVRAIDKSGNTSAWTTGVSGTTAGVNTGDIGSGQVQGGNIGSGAVDTQHIANLAVENAQIASLAVQTAKIENLDITNAKIGNLQVDTDKRIDVLNGTFTNALFNLSGNTKKTVTHSFAHNLGEEVITVIRMQNNVAATNGLITSVYLDTNSTTTTTIRWECANTGGVGTWNNISLGGEVYYW